MITLLGGCVCVCAGGKESPGGCHLAACVMVVHVKLYTKVVLPGLHLIAI